MVSAVRETVYFVSRTLDARVSGLAMEAVLTLESLTLLLSTGAEARAVDLSATSRVEDRGAG